VTIKKSILFIGEAVSLAHISRPLVLSQSLDLQRYDIHFACDMRYQSLVTVIPHIKYWPIHSVSGKSFIKGADQGGYIWQKKDIESYIDEEMALFRKVSPSLIVGDFRFTASTSAEISCIPYAMLANVHWSPYRRLEFDPNPSQPRILTLKKKALKKLMPWRQYESTGFLNTIRERNGLPPLKDYFDLATHGNYTLYAEPPGFIQTTTLPEHHQFLGPVIWSPDVSTPSWWKTWKSDVPLIYLTLGSTGVANRLPEIIESLQGIPATIVVTTAGRIKLKSVPENVYIADYIPGLDICKLASVVVCNGGSATAYQALSVGTPVVGIWSNVDQYLTTMVIEQTGAGLGCRASHSDSRTIRRFILDILQNSYYRTHAATVAKLFGSHDARGHFRDFVDKFFESGG
jgi:UDP:flavonoid glycosyltransferase YjiC (YdhE family)